MNWCKECDKDKKKKYYEKNKEIIIKKNKQYYLENKGINRESHKKWKKKWLLTEQGRISNNISRALKRALGENKRNHWEDVLGYTVNDLLKHLNSGDFTVKDYLEGDFHIDHIIPESLFVYKNKNDVEFKKCWDYRNLRIWPANENISKTNSFNLDLIKEYNIKDLIPIGVKL